MKKIIFFLIFTSSFLYGCEYRHMDYLESFLFKGVVLEKNTNRPLDQVTIAFVDTGFDYVRSNKMIKIVIGESDPFGIINIKYNYLWGQNVYFFSKEPSKTFNVVISKTNYKEKVLNFKASDLNKDGNTLIVSLGNIILEPASENLSPINAGK